MKVKMKMKCGVVECCSPRRDILSGSLVPIDMMYHQRCMMHFVCIQIKLNI